MSFGSFHRPPQRQSTNVHVVRRRALSLARRLATIFEYERGGTMTTAIISSTCRSGATPIEEYVTYTRTDGRFVEMTLLLDDSGPPALLIGCFTDRERRRGEPGAGLDLTLAQAAQLRDVLARSAPSRPTSASVRALVSDSACYRRDEVYVEQILTRCGVCFEIGVPAALMIDGSPASHTFLSREELSLLRSLLMREAVQEVLDCWQEYADQEDIAA